MNKYSTRTEAFLGSLIGSFLGTLASQYIKTPEDFKKACQILEQKLKEYKPLEQMTIDELQKILQKNVDQENYEEAEKIKRLINYKKGL